MTAIVWGATAGIRLDVDDEGQVRLVHLGPDPAAATGVEPHRAVGPTELQVAGARLPMHQRHIGYEIPTRLRYRHHRDERVAAGSRLVLVQEDPVTGLEVTTIWTAHDAAPEAITTVARVRNGGSSAQRVEHVAALTFAGFLEQPTPDWYHRFTAAVVRNSFYSEFRWEQRTLADYGVVEAGALLSRTEVRNRLTVSSVGSMPTVEYLPLGALRDDTTGVAWVWQIEHNGSWSWEIGAHASGPYLAAGGPTDQEHQWSVLLAPGAEFESVPVTVAVSPDGIEAGIATLVRHRRLARRRHRDHDRPVVVFNDWMNCLRADPDEAKLRALVPKVSKLGVDVFCIDAGWYADDGDWWDTVGAWEESTTRFPSGLGAVVDLIRENGMRPGLWIEPEVVGVRSPVAGELPSEAFLTRAGHRINAGGRYLLDFRQQLVRSRMDRIIDGLIGRYGLEYLKFDYNVTSGVGADAGGVSPGHGLLAHNRALLEWVDDLLSRHPDVVIESCSAGGARVDAATLRRYPIFSTSDQHDPLRYATIATGAALAATPEQSGIWVSPLTTMSSEETILCVVNALLGRPQLSGHSAELAGDRRRLLVEGIDWYRRNRDRLQDGIPRWPLGLPGWDDDHLVNGLRWEDRLLLAVWRRGGPEPRVRIPLPEHAGQDLVVTCAYPLGRAPETAWDPAAATLTVDLPSAPMARLLEVRPRVS